MSMPLGQLVCLLALSAGLLSGCAKTVTLSFLNLTGDSLDVFVTTPQDGRRDVGVVPPMGRIEHTVFVPYDRLPANCTWQTGSVSQKLTITRDTGDQEITILPTGAARVRGRDSTLQGEFEDDMDMVPPGRAAPASPLGAPGGL
jgi:hypothetical protein